MFTWQVATFDVFLVVFCASCESLAQLPGGRWQRAITDNAIHASIGALVWLTVSADRITWTVLAQTVLCAFLSSAIDVDHFIAASSFTLEGALSLQTRPPFHNSNLLVLVNVLLAMCSLYLPFAWPASCLFACAWISHHLRDSTRRGLWLAPFDHTRPVPTWLYLSLIAVLPLVIRTFQHRSSASGVNTDSHSSRVFTKTLLSV